MDEAAVRRAIARMAAEIVERNAGVEGLALMGVQRRGVQLAALLAAEIEASEGRPIPQGSIDITFYRDDLMAIGPRPVVGESRLPPEGIDDRAIVIVDDVLYTGRTVRAALNELGDWGRPSRIDLCVLIDRGDRELPIHADYVGKTITPMPDQTVEVCVPELDGDLSVNIVSLPTEPE
jgi:pyrimidine operon attenuation protein/uracil phosphoribosyltransferase